MRTNTTTADSAMNNDWVSDCNVLTVQYSGKSHYLSPPMKEPFVQSVLRAINFPDADNAAKDATCTTYLILKPPFGKRMVITLLNGAQVTVIEWWDGLPFSA